MTTQLSIDRNRLADICRQRHIKRLLLYGSAARGDFNAESDVDLLVEFEEGHTPGFAFFTIQRELSERFGRPADLNAAQSLSKHFRETALSEAQLIFSIE